MSRKLDYRVDVCQYLHTDPYSLRSTSPLAARRRAQTHLCVWELAAVWHETKAWERFLKSARDEAAAQLWLADRYSGAA